MNKLFKKLLFWIPAFAGMTILIFSIYIYHAGYHPAILMYHHVSPKNSETDVLVVDPSDFEKQMAFFNAHHYHVVSLEEITYRIQQHENIPFKTVAITFDDGYLDNYIYAYPVLKKYHLPATIFLVTDWVEKSNFVTWNQIKEMEEHDIRFGNHTVTHPGLSALPLNEAQKEILKAQKILNTHLQKPLSILCYPFGGYSSDIQKISKDLGYGAAMATSPDGFSPLDDIYALRRVRISKSSSSLFIFWLETSGYYGWIRQMQKKLKKWKKY